MDRMDLNLVFSSIEINWQQWAEPVAFAILVKLKRNEAQFSTIVPQILIFTVYTDSFDQLYIAP